MEIVLIAIIMVFVVTSLICVYYLNKKIDQKAGFIQSVQKEVSRLSHSMLNNKQEVQTLYDRLRHIEGRIDQLSLKEPAQQTYRHAVKLVKSGACINEVVESCGLSRGEAELIMLLNKMGTSEPGVSKNDMG